VRPSDWQTSSHLAFENVRARGESSPSRDIIMASGYMYS
jgi:hypothetical protein